MDTYEKKYKEALGWMQSLYNGLHGKTKEEAERYFPELKDEDEKIRKDIINYLNVANQIIPQFQKDKWIAWLEKQGEQKPQRMISAEAKEAMYGKPAWSEEDECYMVECINAIATKEGWSFEEKRKTKHWLKSLKQRIEGE